MKNSSFSRFYRVLCTFSAFLAVISVLCVPSHAVPGTDDAEMLSRMAEAVAPGKPFSVRVAVCAVMLNRVSSPGFPDTLPAVTAGMVSSLRERGADYTAIVPDARSRRAAATALRGGDPTRGSVYFAESGNVPPDIRESGRIRFEGGGFAFWR